MTPPPARVLVVQHEDDAGLGRFGPLLRANRVEVDVVRPDRGDAQPSTAARYAGVIVLGGEMAAWEDERAPWLPATRELIRACVADGVPYLGVCLGAQLLGLACGGRVDRGPAGLEAGLVDLTFTPAAAADELVGAVAAAVGPTPRAVGWHGDAVLELPADAVLLGTGAVYPHQAFRVGAAAWGVQYHPEVVTDDARTWAATSGEALARRGLDPEAVLGAIAAAEAELALLARAHVDGFIAVVRAHNLPEVADVSQA